MRARADGADGIEYANLAVRGRLVRQVIAEQVPAALALGPGPGEHRRRGQRLPAPALRPGSARDRTRERSARAARRRAATCCCSRSATRPAGRGRWPRCGSASARYNSAVRAIAEHYDCYLVSFWEVAAYDDDRLWDEDRLHLSPGGPSARGPHGPGGAGGRRSVVADAGRAGAASAAARRRRRRTCGWTTGHLAPWVVRRMRGESSGDAVPPKHPTWVTLPGRLAALENTK